MEPGQLSRCCEQAVAWKTDERFDFQQGKKVLLFFQASRPALEALDLPTQQVTGARAVKLAKRFHLAPRLSMRGAVPTFRNYN
jgi:NAD-dependent DNA ligase